eukprot:CAMPEP_0172524924 /NCGR_PEP_ID=MMETSP1066-20121228/294442_1 /TAXON_ID=671091 /ORGANISM="Coscinodiscus wailesii, Strain CCMP2513" /LENGTH=289 /DNA_ID=CAMNT_0013308081 /DNA_START=109 /DNA_END=978 /DNA_ORIENTATION=-
MSLANQTCWVVGGVGVIGRGITRGLLSAGATVIVNSRSPERLEALSKGLGNPDRLVMVQGSLLPGYASKTVADTLKSGNPLNHVVSHGAVRWWTRPAPGHFDHYVYHAGCDESYSLNIRGGTNLLDMKCEEFITSSAQLASLHFSAAQELIPRVAASGGPSTYTFVTGDGSGKPNGKRTAMGEINSHHVWGLSAALREELSSQQSQGKSSVMCREIRVGLPVQEAQGAHPYISEEIGDLCAGIASAFSKKSDNGRLIKIEDEKSLESLLAEYNISRDERVGELPHHLCG